MFALQDRFNRIASHLSDDELQAAIRAAERCAQCMTRSRRDFELVRLRCFRCELDRRAAPEQARPA